MTKIDDKIARLEKELAEAKEAKKKNDEDIHLSGLNPVLVDVATNIHDTMCHRNHTDQCGWYYEKWSDVDLTKQGYGKGHTRREYYRVADKIAKQMFMFYADLLVADHRHIKGQARAKLCCDNIKKIMKIIKENNL